MYKQGAFDGRDFTGFLSGMMGVGGGHHGLLLWAPGGMVASM